MSLEVRPIEDRRLLGIGLALIGYIGFTIIDACAKWLTVGGMPLGQVVFVRYVAQLVIVAALLLPRHGLRILATKSLVLEVVRALALLSSTIFNFLALHYLPLTTTATIMFTIPLMLVALSIPVLGETVGWRRWAAVIVGFIGVLIIVRPGTAEFHPAVGISLLAAAGGAIYMLLTRKLAGVDAPSTQLLYVGIIGTGVMAPFALIDWMWPDDPGMWIAFALIGLAGLGGHYAITVAHRFAPASVLAPFSYLQIVSMSLFSWLLFNQPPEVWLYVGAPIVIGSGLYIWLRERRLARGTATE